MLKKNQQENITKIKQLTDKNKTTNLMTIETRKIINQEKTIKLAK